MKKYSTKKALIASVLMLALCFSSLIGTTFAWFTDSVTSSGNVIKTGTLDVAMYWAEGNEDPTAVSEWKDASKGAIFKNDKWEPGYSEAKHIKIDNIGTLALKYQMRIMANGTVSELADVIDVYYFADAKQLSRADFVDTNKLGTLTEVLNATHAKNISNTIAGSLESGKTKTVTLAFKMQESAGNEYQNLSVGSDFSIQLLATQYTSEKDSFDNLYDEGASFPAQEVPAANVFILNQSKLAGITAGATGKPLDVGYSFQPTETKDEVEGTEKANWHADFFVYADKQVPAESMALAGYYNAFNGLNFNGQTLSETNWIALTSPTAIAAGAANGVRLIESMDVSVPYLDVCKYGNDGTGFLCGATDLTGANAGTTLTVELRLYKTYTEEECLEIFGYKSANKETGEYITVGKFTYTFGGEYVTLADGTVAFASDDGEVWLRHTANVEVGSDGVYYVPDGVTCVGQANGSPEHGGFQVFSSNSDIKKVVFPDSVTSIGYQAFKQSAVEEVVINDGITEIGAYAFNNAKSLKTYNIPDSVTSIGKQAFASTAASEIIVPENVEFIDEGAFRYMSNLTTVTVKGNPQIGEFAFRNNPALMNVYLLGDDVTFAGTSMAFAFDNTGKATDMTIYVANTTVAARVYTAQGSAYGYEVKVLGDAADGSDASDVANAKNVAAYDQAIDNGTDTIILGSGDFVLDKGQNMDSLTIVGNGSTNIVLENNELPSGSGDFCFQGSNVVLENVTITTGNQTWDGFQNAKSLVLKNCVINGNLFLSGNATFIECEFNIPTNVNAYNVWAYSSNYGHYTAEFIDCDFNCSGKSIYVDGNGSNGITVNFTGCTFNDNGDDTVVNDKAAIETGTTYGQTYDINITDCEFNGYTVNPTGLSTGTNVWGNKNSMTSDKLNVVIDGVDVY